MSSAAADGVTYPEWDATRRAYRPAWCTVREVEPKVNASATQAIDDAIGLRRPLSRLGMGLHRRHRQSQGDDIDIDAAVEARVEVRAGSVPDEAVYLDSLRRRRDLSVLLLLDVSGSAAEPGTLGRTVHEQQRAAVANLTVALHDLGDRVALYAYYSQGRSAVSMVPVKRFDDHLDARVIRRLNSLEPGAYSRLGAAIRHGSAVLEARGGTSRRLLVVLSDGLAYDHGYERAYGAADARRALAEARRPGHRLRVPDDRRGNRRAVAAQGVRQRRARDDRAAGATRRRDRPAISLRAALGGASAGGCRDSSCCYVPECSWRLSVEAVQARYPFGIGLETNICSG